MSTKIVFKLLNSSINPAKFTLHLHDYILLDTFLLKFNEFIYKQGAGTLTKDSLTEFLTPYGSLLFSSSVKDRNVNIVVNVKTKDITFKKDFSVSDDNSLTETDDQNDKEVASEADIKGKTTYQLFLDAVNEFRMAESLISVQIDRIAKCFYDVFMPCECFMFAYFDDYPDITRLEVFNAIQTGVATHEEWLYNAISFMEQYVETIKKHFPKVNGKIFIHVPISEENTALEKGAVYDKEEFLFYYTEEDDAYLFGRWLPISINLNSEDNTILKKNSTDVIE